MALYKYVYYYYYYYYYYITLIYQCAFDWLVCIFRSAFYPKFDKKYGICSAYVIQTAVASDLYCVEWGVKLYSLTQYFTHE